MLSQLGISSPGNSASAGVAAAIIFLALLVTRAEEMFHVLFLLPVAIAGRSGLKSGLGGAGAAILLESVVVWVTHGELFGPGYAGRVLPIWALLVTAGAIAGSGSPYGEVSRSRAPGRPPRIPRMLTAMLRHVKMRRRAGAELRELRRTYRALADSVSDSVVVLVGDQAVYHNRVYVGLIGQGATRFLDDVAPEDQAPFRQFYGQYYGAHSGMRHLDGEASDPFKVDLVTQAGTRVSMEARASAVDYQGQPGTMVVMHNVTERDQMQEQLVQAQKMESVGRLAGCVAHDFNNLLSAVMGYAQLADLQLRAEGRIDGNYLDEIRSAAERGAQLTSQLLAFSRRQVTEARVLDLNDLITNLDRMLRRLIGEHVELVVLHSPDAGSIRADSGQMEQVVTNLVVNARDAMPGGGTLTIKTGHVTIGDAADVQAGDYATVAVSDTGMGMPAHVVERIFEPFFTTKERGHGTGLGLSTCHGILQEHGGHITVASQPGEGSTFTIYLPSVESSPGPAQVPEHPLGMLTGSETVLLVEDEPAVRRLTAEVLRGQGYSVLQASNGFDALRIIASVPEKEIALLLTDVVMPAMGGGELADRFRESYPDARVLYMSGYPDARVTETDRSPDDARFLQKPVTMSVLAREVRETLDV